MLAVVGSLMLSSVCIYMYVVVMVATSVVFSVLLLLLTIELVWRTRQLRYD